MPTDRPEEVSLTREDLDAASDRLESLMVELPEQERAVLGWILARAQAAGEADVPVPDETPPVRTLLADLAGFSPEARGSEISVSWKHSFAN